VYDVGTEVHVMQTAGTLVMSLVPVLAAVLAAGCGGSGGGACGATCGMKSECAAVGSSLSALAAVGAGNAAAMGSLPGTPRWAGGIQGLKITRDGKPSPEPDAQIGNTKIYTSGWVFKFCAGMEEIVFGAGPPTSTAEKGCGTINCAALPEFTLPQKDSAEVIAAAFPSDPAETTYNLQIILLGSTSRIWQVTKRPSGPAVKVDADTGAVVP
jgi:hypothetical protein